MRNFTAVSADDASEVFADIEHHITSLHLIFQLVFDDHDARAAKRHHRCIDWIAHVFQLQHENLFKRSYYGMSLAAFKNLTRILGKSIVVDEAYSPVDEPIIQEMLLPLE
jgi:hypothetical protein